MKKHYNHFLKSSSKRIYLIFLLSLCTSVANAQSVTWAFLKGFAELQGTPVYGTMGVADPANLPGARHSSATWQIGSKLYLFGGGATTSNSSYLNDMWEYDTDTGNWRWIKGNSSTNQAATYGTLGEPAEANSPGGRGNSVTWVSGGKLYLFGGQTYILPGNNRRLNDLWVFDPATGYWCWIKGSSLFDQNAIYGTIGVAASANTPGSRHSSVSWESGGKLYLFGGQAYISSIDSKLNDLWVFDPATGYWCWIKGSSLANQTGTYGTLGVAAAANTPGGRFGSVSWEIEGKLYLFGGGNGQQFNDLWEYEVETGHWRWIKGSNSTNQAGIYGTRGTAAAANTPGTRYNSEGWESGGKLFLFGGFGRSSTNSGTLNDLWEYNPDTGHWRWIKGSNLPNKLGILGSLEAANQPGARDDAISWKAGGKLYLFGGTGSSITDQRSSIRGDLWSATFVSTSAALTSLTLSDGTLSPDFHSDTTSYSTSVSNSTTSITVTPTVSDATASVKVNGVGVTSGSASAAISLSGGSNTITTVVTAQDGETTKTYTLIINRALSTNANLAALSTSSGTIDPVFDAAKLSYAASVPFATSSITVTPTLSEANATIQVQVNGGGYSSVTSASASAALALNVGSNTIDVKVTAQDGTTIKTYTITVTREKADQVITFNAFSAKKYGDAAFELAATGGASGNPLIYVSTVPTVASVSGNIFTIVGTGETEIRVSQEGNANYNAAPDAVQTLIVTKGDQTITFAALPAKTFGDAAFNLTATGGASGNAVTYVSSNPAVATVSGNTITIVGAGTTNITASQTANTNYNSATDVVQELAVSKASQTITFAALPAKAFGDAAFNLTATGGASGNAVTYVSSNTAVATVSGNTVTIVGAGTTNITASQAANTNYNAANDVVQELTVGKAVQTITFAALPAKTFGDAAFNLTATGGASGNAVTYVSSNPAVATISGNTITIVGAGTTNITASQTANTNYNSANDVVQELAVSKASQTITFAALPAKAFGDAAFNLTATGGASGNAVTYVSSNKAVATVSGNTVTIVGAGTTNITASQAANTNYNAANDVVQELTVGKAVQTITFAALPAKTFGDAAFNLTATGGGSGNAVTYASSNTAVATVSGNTVTIVGAGTTNITASQAANTNYNAATDVVQELAVGKAFQTITFAALPAKTFGDAAFDLTATGGASGNALTYFSSNTAVATISGTRVTILGAGSTNITASQAGNTNYNAASDVVQSLIINKAGQSINFSALAAKTFGDAAFDLTATGGASGNALTYLSSNTAVATISGRTVTLVGAGSTNITASQAGNANYTDAADVQQVLIVNKGVSAIAKLSALGLSTGILSPVFSASTTSYSASVANNISSVTITPAAEQSEATIRVNGSLVNSGIASGIIALNVGSNTISTVVTAQDGSTSKTYTITITRAVAILSSVSTLSSLSLSAGILSPAFSPSISSYTAYVNNGISSVTLSPVADQAGASIKINGNTVTAKNPSGKIALNAGENTITTIVTAEDGKSTNTYVVKVTRLQPEQILPDTGGNSTVNNTSNQVLITSPAQAVTVTVAAGTTAAPSISYGNLISGGTGTIPQTSINSPLANVQIPAGTVVTGSNSTWNGVIYAPAVSSYDLPVVPGEVTTVGLIIEVGSETNSLSFSKGVRLLLPGQSGMRVARVHGLVYTEITAVGSSDTQAAGDALPAEGAFKINVGADLVIWTKAFSRFITFTQTTDLNVAVVASDKDALTEDLIKGANTDLNHITTTLTNPLPATLPGGSEVSWTSSNAAIISADGQTLNRPLMGLPNPLVTLTATVKKGLITDTKTFNLKVLPLANLAPTLGPIVNQPAICPAPVLQSIALSGISAGPESGQSTTLSVSSNKPDLLNQLSVTSNGSTGAITYMPVPGASGTAIITVIVKDNGGTEDGGTDAISRSFTVTINPLPSIHISNSAGNSLSKGNTAVLTASGGTEYSWVTQSGIINGQNSAVLTVRPAKTTSYTVKVTSAMGCISSHSITVNVIDDYQALEAMNILTPNGDGKNDYLVIKNLDYYPDHSLRIFDRSGRIIYQKVDYQNDWDGSFEGSPLAQGTYYYVIDFGAGKNRLKGFVSIVK
ncbi:MAG TPA: cadherin-like beta sandwich domain-containing protein [Daejeonella sp.]|uniref:cadherin-like beta sandwich domain-containing protein n=1 Tax=Daejeonella sp. TaxID=2805397 RepID=UPI002ED857ED